MGYLDRVRAICQFGCGLYGDFARAIDYFVRVSDRAIGLFGYLAIAYLAFGYGLFCY